MNTLIKREAEIVALPKSSQVVEEEPRSPVKAGFSFRRFFTWYKNAVLSPETEAEKAEWQKTSF